MNYEAYKKVIPVTAGNEYELGYEGILNRGSRMV